MLQFSKYNHFQNSKCLFCSLLLHIANSDYHKRSFLKKIADKKFMDAAKAAVG